MTNLRVHRLVWTVLAPSAALVVAIVGARFLMHAPVDWNRWRSATCMPGACFCEAIRDGTVRQVANTWSSFAFVWVAFWVVGVARYDRTSGMRHVSDNASDDARRSWNAMRTNATRSNSHRANLNAMSQRVMYPLLYAGALLVVGVGSAFYHASLTLAGQFADVFGMYLIGTFVLVYNVGRVRPMSDRSAIVIYIALNATLALVLYLIPEWRRYAFAMVIVVALIVEVLVRRRRSVRADARYLVAAVSALAVAFVVWTLDLQRVVCNATTVWQGHALWHLLGAAACAGVYLFYRSESGGDGIARPTRGL